MKTITKKILAGASAIAIGAALNTGTADAAFNGNIGIGSPFTMDAGLTAEDTIDVAVTPGGLAFGTFGTLSDPGVNTASASMTAASPTVFTPSTTGGTAKIIDGKLNDHAAAVIDVTTAFHAVAMYASYGNIVDLKGAAGDILQVVSIGDNMITTNGGCAVTVNNAPPAADVCTNTTGIAPTDNAGALKILVGGVIKTVATVNYHSEAYAGSFDITLSY